MGSKISVAWLLQPFSVLFQFQVDFELTFKIAGWVGVEKINSNLRFQLSYSSSKSNYKLGGKLHTRNFHIRVLFLSIG